MTQSVTPSVEKKNEIWTNLLNWIRKIEIKNKLEDLLPVELKVLLVQIENMRILHKVPNTLPDIPMDKRGNEKLVLVVKLLVNYELKIITLIHKKTAWQQAEQLRERQRAFRGIGNKAQIISNRRWSKETGGYVLCTSIIPSEEFIEKRLAIGLGEYKPYTHVKSIR